MNCYPSDPETGVCLSGQLGGGPEGRQSDNIGSIISMLITDQVGLGGAGLQQLFTASSMP